MYKWFVLLAFASAAHAAVVPSAAKRYERDLIRISQLLNGLDAPVARYAAQIHQESYWNKDAKSRYAHGLAQFTPSTSEWFSGVYPEHLAANTPYSPVWAMKALVLYDTWLGKRVSAINDCETWGMTLSAYNGGLGWVNRDKRLVPNPEAWFCGVETKSNRADWAFKENRNYPRRILLELEPLYVGDNWPGATVCAYAPSFSEPGTCDVVLAVHDGPDGGVHNAGESRERVAEDRSAGFFTDLFRAISRFFGWNHYGWGV